MKKFIFALFALVISLSMMAQDYVITTDEAHADGSRSIMCELVNTRSFTDKQVFHVGLSSLIINVDGEKRIKKYLVLKVVTLAQHKIPEGSLLLVKNVDGEVLELRSISEGDAMVRKTEWIGNTPIAQYYASVFYTVTEEDLEFLKKGIVKFRQETNYGKHEKEYKKEKEIKKVTDVIINHDKLINEALAKEKTFDSDF